MFEAQSKNESINRTRNSSIYMEIGFHFESPVSELGSLEVDHDTYEP